MDYATRTVGEVAADLPQSTRVFEKYGIDYCCGGKKPMAEACESAGVSVDSVVEQIAREVNDSQQRGQAGDWSRVSLRDFISHVVQTHHVFTRESFARLLPLSVKVSGKHGERRPELLRVHQLVNELAQELGPHLMKEEQILFPFVTMMEDASKANGEMPALPFGTLQNPIRMMMMEHEQAGGILAELRKVTGGYALPEDACMSYQAFFHGLEELEKDLHQHIHLENNVLFPRSVRLEETFATAHTS